MTPIRIFISSVQREFSRERERLRDYLRADPLMIRRCAKAGLPEPEFEVGAGFVATIWRAGGTTRGRPDTTQEESGTTPITTAIADSTTAKTTGKTTAKRILALLRRDPEISLAAVASRVGLTVDGVRYHIRKLKSAGAIRRVGSSRAGRWEVLK